MCAFTARTASDPLHVGTKMNEILAYLFIVRVVCMIFMRRVRNLNILRFLIRCTQNQPRRRRIWMRSRSKEWWRNAFENYTDENWIKEFRLTRSAFNQVVTLVRDEMKPAENWVREPIPLEQRVAIALYQLASTSEFRSTGNVFGVHKTTVHRCLHKFCQALCRAKSQLIYLPGDDEAATIARSNFQRSGFPQVFGAIDGCHIHVKPTRHGFRDYINRKMYPSIVLQGIVDNMYRFRDISVKMPGSVHDASVFRNSGIYAHPEKLPKGTLMLNGVEIPLMMLGDAAYPVMNYLMRPYVGSNLTPEEEHFNMIHSSLRVVVENAFGRLKSRWRILKRQLDVDVKDAPLIIAACCILHNICEDGQIPVPRDESYAYPQPRSVPMMRLTSDNVVRRTITNYLWEQKLL